MRLVHWLQLGFVLFTATLGCALLVLTQRFHGQWTGDHANSGIQKHHEGSPSRVSALPVLLALGLGLWLMPRLPGEAGLQDWVSLMGALLLCSMPAVLLGLADDVSQMVPPRVRMLGAAAAACLAIGLLDNHIPRVGLMGLDVLLTYWPISVLVTLLMVAGFTNAMNIIDGLNGLSAGLGILMCVSTAFLAWKLGDTDVVHMAALLAAALLGFVFVNFPKGRIFLGDGAAYLIGFMLAQIWILLVRRHPDLSPWIVMAIGFLPTMETVFSIIRRRWLHRSKGQAMLADRLHLHSLVYRRRTRLISFMRHRPRWVANAAAAVWLLGFGVVPMVLAVVGPHATWWGALVLVAGVMAYLAWFKRLTTPVVRGSARAAAEELASGTARAGGAVL